MINKQNLWFLTLFSLILVLSVYYITMPNELLLTNNSAVVDKDEEKTANEDDDTSNKEAVVSIEEREAIKSDLESLLTNSSATTEEKNSAYDELQQLNTITGQETSLETKLKEKYKMPVFVKIEDKEITVVIDNDKHDTTLANNIMRSVQEEFKEKMYITVQFK